MMGIYINSTQAQQSKHIKNEKKNVKQLFYVFITMHNDIHTLRGMYNVSHNTSHVILRHDRLYLFMLHYITL